MKIKFIWTILFIAGLAVRSTELFHPIDTTSWRESDMSSIARNYYRNGMDFSHPQIDWGGIGPGYTESEFPVYPYLIALSYKLFGVWEPIGRLISFIFSIGTMIVFFRLSKYLFNTRTAIAVSFFFTLSPILMVTAISIQPESIMFFFYILAASSFIHWVDNQSAKYYISTLCFTALALLCKISAINIGILYFLIIIIKNGWNSLFKPKVILLGLLSIMPSIIWYTYSHRFYLFYGNSLGLSNEYPWIGWDFFSNAYFIKGIIRQELFHVWTFFGPLIFSLAIISTKILKKQTIIFSVCWIISVFIFYFATSRTSADSWAYYYHIFSVPSVSMLLGVSVIEIGDKYLPLMKLRLKPLFNISQILKSRLIITAMFILVSFYVAYSLYYLIRRKPDVFKTSKLFACKSRLLAIIPQGSLILVSGGSCRDNDNYPVAFNSSYFFYWLDHKGYSICYEDQSIENVIAFKEKGVLFYLAEIKAIGQKQGFEDKMKKKFKVELECDGIILFKL